MEQNKQTVPTATSYTSQVRQLNLNDDVTQISDNVILMQNTVNSSGDPSASESSSIFQKKCFKLAIIVTVCVVLGVSSFLYFRENILDLISPTSPQQIHDQLGELQNQPTKPTEPQEPKVQPEQPQQKQVQPKQDEPILGPEPTEEIYDLVLRNSTSALCLDGSPGSYYISRGGDPSKVLLFFQPGGWCGDKDFSSTFQSCYERSQTYLGSSKSLESTWTQDGNVFSKHPENYFKDWKKIHLNYCDGSGHQGTRKQPLKIGDRLVYFRGHNITTENFADLEDRIGLFSKTKQVVVSGISAGGLAVYMWANYVKERVKQAKVYALSDSGIFYDGQNFQTKSHTYKESLVNLMNITNKEIDLPTPQCVQDHPDSKQSCMLAQNLHKYLKVPLFTIQSPFDFWSVWSILNVGCYTVADCENKTEQEKFAMKQFAKGIKTLLQELGNKPQNGVFGIDCMIHGTMYYYSFNSQYFTVPSGSGRTVNKAIGDWMENPTGDNVHIDVGDWPANQGCIKF